MYIFQKFTSLCLNSETSPLSFSPDYSPRSSLQSVRRTLSNSLCPPGEVCQSLLLADTLGWSCSRSSSQLPEGSAPHAVVSCGPKSSTCTAGAEAGPEAWVWSGANPQQESLLPCSQMHAVSLSSLSELCGGRRSCCIYMRSHYTCPYKTPASCLGQCCCGLLWCGRSLCIWYAAPERLASGRCPIVGSVGPWVCSGSRLLSWGS